MKGALSVGHWTEKQHSTFHWRLVHLGIGYGVRPNDRVESDGRSAFSSPLDPSIRKHLLIRLRIIAPIFGIPTRSAERTATPTAGLPQKAGRFQVRLNPLLETIPLFGPLMRYVQNTCSVEISASKTNEIDSKAAPF
jgi:hypothetical protein